MWVLRPGFIWDEPAQQFVTTERSRAAAVRLMGIGRLLWTPIKNTELHCLRIVLGRKAGATSFEDLRTENGVVYPSFLATCEAMGLLKDGALVVETMQQVTKDTVSSKAIRFTFAVLLSEFVVSETLTAELWQKHKVRLCAQPRRDREEQDKGEEIPLSDVEVNTALIDIHTLVRDMTGKSDLRLQDIGLPEPSKELAAVAHLVSSKKKKNWRLRDELYNAEEQALRYQGFANRCNEGQTHALHQIQEAVLATAGDEEPDKGCCG